MNGCAGNTTACDGRDLAPVRLGMSPTVRTFCGACRETAAAMGAVVNLVERRVAALPVVTERRRWIAPWTRRNLARDESGRAA
jgi:CBS-domain-containing membrane protein